MGRHRLYEDRGIANRLADGLRWAVRRVAGLFWLGSLAVALIVTFAQLILWLRTGQWEWWTISDWLRLSKYELWRSNWAGVQLLLNWIAALPIVVAIPGAGLIAGLVTLNTGRLILRQR
jgi:hypothetical protein